MNVENFLRGVARGGGEAKKLLFLAVWKRGKEVVGDGLRRKLLL